MTHPADCFWMYDPKTHRVHVLRDIVWLHRMFYQKKQKSVQEMVTDQVTVGSWSHNPQGVLRFIEVGERISESVVQGNNNSINQNYESINETGAEQHQVEHNPVSNNAGPPGEVMTTSSSRFSRATTRLIEEIGEVALMAAE